jgi:hypothetical protein
MHLNAPCHDRASMICLRTLGSVSIDKFKRRSRERKELEEPQRSDTDMLVEIVERVRRIERNMPSGEADLLSDVLNLPQQYWPRHLWAQLSRSSERARISFLNDLLRRDDSPELRALLLKALFYSEASDGLSELKPDEGGAEGRSRAAFLKLSH